MTCGNDDFSRQTRKDPISFMDEQQTDFWQSHSITFLEMAFRTDHQERLNDADGHGKKTGDCGDTVEFFLKLDGDRIQTLSYAVNGCMYTNACANAVIELAKGKSLDNAWEIQPETVADYLETLPEDHFHCAELAVGAFYLTMAGAREIRRSSWKKLYSTPEK
jgi:nitrogen fixation NifU-like protein